MVRSTLSLLLLAAALFVGPARLTHAATSPKTLRVCNACRDAVMRVAPEVSSAILQPLKPRSTVTLIQAAPDNAWLLVRSGEGLSGWVERARIEGRVRKRAARDRNAPAPVLVKPASRPADVASQTTSARASAPSLRAIAARGQKLGNRKDVFSKIGDSLTAVPYVMYPIGWGRFNLHERVDLLPAAEHFRHREARDGNNSFINHSLAAYGGWTSSDVLNHAKADPTKCFTGETPLRCEYRNTRPAVALILLGTNDVSALDADTYRANMTRIVQETIDAGVIPVLSTIPPRMQFEGPCDAFNVILADIAAQFNIPLSDYAKAMKSLPNYGLSDDGVHPSWPPGDPVLSADFSSKNLNTGYTLRNLMILQSLDAVWRRALQ